MTIMNHSDSLIFLRNQIVSIILADKKLTALFSRDLQYLAIAIIDKLISSISSQLCILDQFIQECYYAIAALLIAFKYMKNNSLGLKQIIAILKKPQEMGEKYQIQQVIKTQGIILQKIDFQIPQTTSYVVLQNFLNSDIIKPSRKQLQIIKTMKLLKQITLVTYEASFCPQIGKQLYEFVDGKKSSERCKKFYKLAISSLQTKNAVKS